jgi:retron-type reverse transcriptase
MTTWTSKISSIDILSAARKKKSLDLSDIHLQQLSADISAGNFKFGTARRFFKMKTDGTERPLVSLAPTDTLVMRAMLDIVQPELNSNISDFCYSRAGAGVAQAVATLHTDLLSFKPAVVFVGDFSDYYGMIDRDVLIAPLMRHFESDPVLCEMLLNILNINVVDSSGKDARRPSGIEQGLPVSPLLSNLYLSGVFDAWVQDHGVHAWGRYGDDFYVFPQSTSEIFGKGLKKHLGSVSLELKQTKLQVSHGFSADAVKALDPSQRNDPDAINWLKTSFVPHRMASGNYNVIVEKVGEVSDDEDE